MPAKTPTNITLYTEGTPNGLKPTILLSELGLDYKVLLLLRVEAVLSLTLSFSSLSK